MIGNAGAYSVEMDLVLSGATDEGKLGVPKYSDTLVVELSAEAAKGNPVRGEKIFNNAAISCIACHQVGDRVITLGPDLSAVGAGLPVELIVESIIWPRRQVKEGFLSSTITTKHGQFVNGYIQREDKKRVEIRDVATGAVTNIAVSNIASRTDAGTLMPAGLTANLTRKEFADMVAWLASLKGE